MQSLSQSLIQDFACATMTNEPPSSLHPKELVSDGPVRRTGSRNLLRCDHVVRRKGSRDLLMSPLEVAHHPKSAGFAQIPKLGCGGA